MQTRGCYLFEPGGSIRPLVVHSKNTESTYNFMVVNGANINFDLKGNFLNTMNAGWIKNEVGKNTICI